MKKISEKANNILIEINKEYLQLNDDKCKHHKTTLTEINYKINTIEEIIKLIETHENNKDRIKANAEYQRLNKIYKLIKKINIKYNLKPQVKPIRLTHLAYQNQRIENLIKWESIEGSKPEYKNRLIFTIDKLIQQEIYLTKKYGYDEEMKYIEIFERIENIRLWDNLIQISKPNILKKPKKEKRQRIKSEGIKIPNPQKHKNIATKI